MTDLPACVGIEAVISVYNYAIERGDLIAAREALDSYNRHIDTCPRCFRLRGFA